MVRARTEPTVPISQDMTAHIHLWANGERTVLMGTFSGGLRLLFIFGATLVLVTAQPPQEAYPGQATHQAPPAGWMCQPQHPQGFGVPLDHVCTCQRMAGLNQNGLCAQDPADRGPVREDPKCTVFCHMDSCACPVHQCDTE